jgi:hypothetical protein
MPRTVASIEQHSNPIEESSSFRLDHGHRKKKWTRGHPTGDHFFSILYVNQPPIPGQSAFGTMPQTRKTISKNDTNTPKHDANMSTNESSTCLTGPPQTIRHVCIRVPSTRKDLDESDRQTLQQQFKECGEDREQYVRRRLGTNGIYCARPCRMGGWGQSKTVSAGSMFANPYKPQEHSLKGCLQLYRDYIRKRAAIDTTTKDITALLGSNAETCLQLDVVGTSFRDCVCSLKGIKLGCWCLENTRECHVEVLLDLAEEFSQSPQSWRNSNVQGIVREEYNTCNSCDSGSDDIGGGGGDGGGGACVAPPRKEEVSHSDSSISSSSGDDGGVSGGGGGSSTCVVPPCIQDGDVYEGEWKDGVPHGHGKMVYSDGDVYEGEWKDGVPHGHGKMVYSDGDVYEGEWKDGDPHGHGKQKYSDGTVYDGNWIDGTPNGHCKVTYANGNVYDGEFYRQDKNGHGKFTLADGTIYNGNWIDGTPNGHFKATYTTGVTYEGESKDGRPHGWGKLTLADGKILEGEWKDGHHQMDGKYIIIDTLLSSISSSNVSNLLDLQANRKGKREESIGNNSRDSGDDNASNGVRKGSSCAAEVSSSDGGGNCDGGGNRDGGANREGRREEGGENRNKAAEEISKTCMSPLSAPSQASGMAQLSKYRSAVSSNCLTNNSKVTLWSAVANAWVEPKLPPPVPLAPVKIIEHVSERGLEYMRRCTIEDYRRMCKPELTQAKVKEMFQGLQRYLKASNGITNERTYTVDKKQAPTRLYGYETVQSQPRLVRNVLLAECASDNRTIYFDMKNAGLVMLRYICACLNETSSALDEYVKHREEKQASLCESTGISQKAAKRLFIKSVYSNSFVTKIKVNGTWQTIKDVFFKRFDKEMKQLQRRLILRPELEWAINFARGDKGNKEGSFMAFLLQWLEGHCLFAAMRVAERFGLSIIALIFDGFCTLQKKGLDARAVSDALRDECDCMLPGIAAVGLLWEIEDPDFCLRDEDKREIGEFRIPDVLPPPIMEQEEGEETAATKAFREMVKEFDLTHFRVDGEYVDEGWETPKRDVLCIDQMKKRYIDVLYKWIVVEVHPVTGKKRTLEKEDRFIDRWLYRHGESEGKRIYKRFDQIPHTLTCPDGVYNTWKRWPCLEPIAATEERFVYVLSKALKHLKVIVNNDWTSFEFNLKFYAQAMQYPHIKGGVMIIYYGPEGTGKTTFMKLPHTMFGDAFYSTTKPEEEIWSKFNAQAEGLFMLECSETDRSNMHDFWGRVNGFVSEDKTSIQRKGKDSYEVRNYTRCVGTTNNPVPTKEGRRYAVFESSDELAFHSFKKKKGGRSECGCPCDRCQRLIEYHKEMNNDIMVAPETAYIMGAFLKAWELPADCAITQQDIPDTEALNRVREGSMTQEERFLRWLAEWPHLDGDLNTGQVNTGPMDAFVHHISCYPKAAMWNHFRLWREDKEPGVMHVKGEDDLAMKMNSLSQKVQRAVEGALVRKEKWGGAKRRHLRLDHTKLCEYFESREGMDSEDEESADVVFPDLDDMARNFVRNHLRCHNIE